MSDTYEPRGLYFEDFEVGYTTITRGRTITEADMAGFAGLSGDFNPMHTDEEYCKDTLFKTRVAHGMLVFSVVTGLAYQLGFIDGTVLAFRSIDDWKFSAPVMPGDTVHAEIEVTALKPAPRLGGGSVTLKLRVRNQVGKICQRGSMTVLVASRS